MQPSPEQGALTEKPAAPGHAYKAFISYSSLDLKAAAWLQSFLESYVLPKEVARQLANGEVPSRRLGKVFLDRSDARATSNLGDAIERELGRSEQLVVICSPEAALAGSWTCREIDAFLRLRPKGAVHAAIGRGEPPGCFPAALRGTGGQAPLAGDLRPSSAGGKDGRRKGALKLLAALLGVDFDALWQRDVRRRRARVVASAGVLVSLFGATLAGYHLVGQRSLAATYLSIADRAAEQAQYDLAALAAANAVAVARGHPLMDAHEPTERLRLFRGTGRVGAVLAGHERAIVAVRWDPQSRDAYTAALDGRVFRWRWDDTGRPKLEQLHRFVGPARRLELALEAQRLMVQSETGRVVVLDTRAGGPAEVLPPPSETLRVATLVGRDAVLLGGMRSGALFASKAPYGAWERVGTLGGRVDGVVGHGGEGGLAFDEPGSLGAFDLATRTLTLLRGNKSGQPTNAVSVSLDGALVLESTGDRVNLYDRTRRKLPGYFTWQDRFVMSSAAGAGTAVSLVSGDALVLWDTTRGDLLKQLIVPGCQPTGATAPTCNPSTAIAMGGGAGGEPRFAVGYWDGTIRIWSSAGELAGELRGHVERVSDLVAYEGGRSLVSASEDRSARLWNLSGERAPEDPFAIYCGQTSKAVRDPDALLGASDGAATARRPGADSSLRALIASTSLSDPCP